MPRVAVHLSNGTAVHGRDDIRAILAQLIAAHTEIEISQLVLRRSGPIALAEADWTFRSDGPASSRRIATHHPIVALREVEGTWKIAIAPLWAASPS